MSPGRNSEPLISMPWYSYYLEQSCGIPVMGKDVVIVAANESFTAGSMVSYSCSVNDSHSKVVASVCTEEGKWVPDPINFTCNNSLSNKGILLYWISHRKITSVVSCS